MDKPNANINKKLSVKHNDEVIEAFNLFDADGDKRIQSKEILSLIKALGGHIDCQHVQDLVEACKENGDSLDLEEFLEQWSLFKQKLGDDDEDEDEIKEAFRMYDQDNDGYITKEEMLAAITQMGFVK